MARMSNADAAKWQDIKTKEIPPNQEIWEKIRNAIFTPVKTTESTGRKKKLTYVQAFFQCIAADAAGGDTQAVRLQVDITRYMERNETKVAETVSPYRDDPSWQKLQANIERQRVLARFGQELFTWIYFLSVWEIREKFVAAYGELSDWERLIPYYINADTHKQLFEKLKRREKRKTARGAPFDVGFGKPPIRTRFRPGQSGNPAGLTRANAISEDFRDILLGKVVATGRDGSQTKFTKIELSVTRAMVDALNGNKSARNFMRDIIKVLCEKNLMTLPEPKRRRSAQQEIDPIVKQHADMLLNKVLGLTVPKVCRELVELFSKKYGPVGEFRTSIENFAAKWLGEANAFFSQKEKSEAVDNEEQQLVTPTTTFSKRRPRPAIRKVIPA